MLEWRRKEARGEGEWRPSLGNGGFALTVGVGGGGRKGGGGSEKAEKRRMRELARRHSRRLRRPSGADLRRATGGSWPLLQPSCFSSSHSLHSPILPPPRSVVINIGLH